MLQIESLFIKNEIVCKRCFLLDPDQKLYRLQLYKNILRDIPKLRTIEVEIPDKHDSFCKKN